MLEATLFLLNYWNSQDGFSYKGKVIPYYTSGGSLMFKISKEDKFPVFMDSRSDLRDLEDNIALCLGLPFPTHTFLFIES